MFRGGRVLMLVWEYEWKLGLSVVGLVVMGSVGGGFNGAGGAGDGEVLRAAIEEYQLFTQELEASPGWVVNKDRSIEYLQELVQRDEEMVQRLQALEREVEERADEKLLFIEKLKGNVPFE
ncbi:hypothetical protein Tco_1474751 [Tanacetum coccineum]